MKPFIYDNVMSWMFRRCLNVLRRYQIQNQHQTQSASTLVHHSTHRIQHHQLHTFLHRKSQLHTHALSSHAVLPHTRSISYSYIPRLVLRASTRLPVVLVGGTAAGTAYVVAKVDAARTQLYDSIGGVTTAVGTAIGQVNDALGLAGTRASEGAEEIKDFSSGVWLSLRGYVGGLFEGQEEKRSGNHSDSEGSEREGGKHNPPPTPERIAAAAAMASSLPMMMHADDNDNDADQSTNQLMMLTKKLIEIRSILLSIDHGEGLQLPAIVVIGSQSSGKSSVLEAIVGREFLPKYV